MRRRRLRLGCLAALAPQAAETVHWFCTADGVRLRYLAAGSGRCVVFIPRWCKPGRIIAPRIATVAAPAPQRAG